MAEELEHKHRFPPGHAGPSRGEAGQRESLNPLLLREIDLGCRLQGSFQRSDLHPRLPNPSRSASAGSEHQQAHGYRPGPMA